MASPLLIKLEYAILSVLVHHQAEVESSLPSWYLSLKLAFPEVHDRTQIKNCLKQLFENGLIALKSPWIGDYTVDSGDTDLDFLELGPFTVGLTTLGIVRWDRMGRYPTAEALPTSDAGTNVRLSSSMPPCPERLALSNRLSDAGLGIERAKAALDAAKLRGIQDLTELQLALAHARNSGLGAVQAFDGHLKAHGCMVSGKVNTATGH